MRTPSVVAGLRWRPLPKAEAMPEPTGEISGGASKKEWRNKEYCAAPQASKTTMLQQEEQRWQKDAPTARATSEKERTADGGEDSPLPVADAGEPQPGRNTEFHKRSKRSETTMFLTGQPLHGRSRSRHRQADLQERAGQIPGGGQRETLGGHQGNRGVGYPESGAI